MVSQLILCDKGAERYMVLSHFICDKVIGLYLLLRSLLDIQTKNKCKQYLLKYFEMRTGFFTQLENNPNWALNNPTGMKP